MMPRLTQEQWLALIDEHAASGQTAMAFCAERGIDNKYFSTRKHQLARSATESRFVSVKSKPSESQSIRLTIGAVQLHIPSAIPSAWLVELIKALA
jgi:hypothetical protein